MAKRTIADLTGDASNTLGDLQDFLMVMTLALCGDMTDLKGEQTSAFATVLSHCTALATSARADCGMACDKAQERASHG